MYRFYTAAGNRDSIVIQRTRVFVPVWSVPRRAPTGPPHTPPTRRRVPASVASERGAAARHTSCAVLCAPCDDRVLRPRGDATRVRVRRARRRPARPGRGVVTRTAGSQTSRRTTGKYRLSRGPRRPAGTAYADRETDSPDCPGLCHQRYHGLAMGATRYPHHWRASTLRASRRASRRPQRCS
jgi:hypothetical protein